ncbi:MAG: Rieske 2Fe-2S domain-containing protein [Boseongicola sp.]|nr:Rieske 2Fe-2S domain-containing protein [Boseongicola sp.]
MFQRIRACARDDIETEDLIRFDHHDPTHAIYRSPDDEFCCADGLCSHEAVHLADGLATDHVVERPGHNGQFGLRTGGPRRAPACDRLPTQRVRIEGDDILIGPDGCQPAVRHVAMESSLTCWARRCMPEPRPIPLPPS